jgi:hypothetical protein
VKLAPGRARPLSPEAFVLALPEALHAVEALDADEDGFDNGEELMAGSEPANADSTPRYSECTPAEAAEAAKNGWDVCSFDADYVFKKVWIDFCGRSPNWAELEDFTALPAESQRPTLHTLLDTCLTSAHWSGPNGVVWNLANEKIAPLATLKSGDTFLGEAGDIPLADDTHDDLLFVYAHTGDRDVRELLRATLDPLTYPFSRYEGIGGGDGNGLVGLGNGAYPFTYSPARLERFKSIDGENVTNAPEAGMLMGQPVANVVEWGRVASDSDAFVQNIVREYWTLLLGESPRPRDLAEFTLLWQDLRGQHAYRVERMLHDLIDTEAYGVP